MPGNVDHHAGSGSARGREPRGRATWIVLSCVASGSSRRLAPSRTIGISRATRNPADAPIAATTSANAVTPVNRSTMNRRPWKSHPPPSFFIVVAFDFVGYSKLDDGAVDDNQPCADSLVGRLARV